jgi:hypothetical protein
MLKRALPRLADPERRDLGILRAQAGSVNEKARRADYHAQKSE